MAILTPKEIEKVRAAYLDRQVSDIETLINKALCEGRRAVVTALGEVAGPAVKELWPDIRGIVKRNLQDAGFLSVVVEERLPNHAAFASTSLIIPHGVTSEIYISWGDRVASERDTLSGKAAVH